MGTTLLKSTAGLLLFVAACSSGNVGNTSGGGTAGGGPGTGSGGSGTGTGTGGTGGSGPGPGPGPIPPRVEPGSCGLQQPAFCEKFSMPKQGGRGGDLDETIWSFTRWAHATEYLWTRMPAGTYPDLVFPATFCGQPFAGILPPQDVRMCEGKGVDGTTSAQLNEVFDDQGDFAFHSMRIRQPFDFTGRTGVVVWDVDGKINPLNIGHGWWFEVWITEDPVPMPYHEAPTVTSLARKSVGFAFRFGGGCMKGDVNNWLSALEDVHVTDDYTFLHAYPFWELQAMPEKCVKVADAKLNHYELHISKDKAELWASDYENPGSFKLRTVANNLDLGFSKGYVHFQHAQYNASKDGHVTRSQTFRWDNIGFDGPTYPTPRGFDVQENNEPVTKDGQTGVRFGWYIDDGKPKTFTVPGVNIDGALSATFNFDIFEGQGQTIQYKFNGHAPHTFVVPVRSGLYDAQSMHGFSLDAPLSELVNGDNVVEVLVPQPQGVEGIGNLDITVEAP